MDKQKGGKVVATLVLLALVVPFVIYAFPAGIGADRGFVVTSGSMSPAIETGDAVIVKETDPTTIQEGDIITFAQSNDESPTTHRVVDVDQRDGQITFETKGDANEDPDPAPIPASNVLGTVVLTIPYIGYVIQFVNTTLGFILLVALPLVALATSEVWQFMKRHRNSTESTTSKSSPTEAEDEPDESTATNGVTTLTVRPADLATTTILLVLVVPYAAYVALQLQTPLTFSVVFASFFTAIAASTLLLTERRSKADHSDSDSADESPTLSLNPTDLVTTTILLAVVTPYVAYVAIQLRTPLTFSVLFASLLTALATGGLLLAERPSKDEQPNNSAEETDTRSDVPPEPTPDGGTTEEVE